MEEDELDRFFEAKQRENLRDHAAEIKPRSSRDQAEIRPRSGRDQAELRARARLVERRCEGVETFARGRETRRHEQHLRCNQFARRSMNGFMSALMCRVRQYRGECPLIRRLDHLALLPKLRIDHLRASRGASAAIICFMNRSGK